MQTRHHTLSTDLGIAGGALAGGLMLGAGLMAILDPQMGRTRRAFLGQKTQKLVRRTGWALQGQTKDLRNRTRGLLAGARSRMKRNDCPADVILINRIRSAIGHVCSHPHAIDVQACSGRVLVWGPILEAEAAPVIGTVWSVPGVSEVEDHLQRFTDARHIPSLQGGETRRTRALRRSGYVTGGSLLTLSALITAGIAAVRLLDLDFDEVTDRIAAPFRGERTGLDRLGNTELDEMERLGNVPDWVEEHEEHIIIDRRR